MKSSFLGLALLVVVLGFSHHSPAFPNFPYFCFTAKISLKHQTFSTFFLLYTISSKYVIIFDYYRHLKLFKDTNCELNQNFHCWAKVVVLGFPYLLQLQFSSPFNFLQRRQCFRHSKSACFVELLHDIFVNSALIWLHGGFAEV